MGLTKRSTTRAKATDWTVLMPLLNAMYGEFKDLSKKKPDSAIGKGKVRVVNRLLEKCRQVLADESSLEFLDLLEDETLPQNSDVVLGLSQHVAAMKQFRSAYYGWQGDVYAWVVEDGTMEDTDEVDGTGQKDDDV